MDNPQSVDSSKEESVSPRERKIRATKFEQSVKDFLERLEFQDVDGARDNFMIGGIQVDVCGGHEDTLLIVECISSQSQDRIGVLRSKIREFRGAHQSLERGFKSNPKFGKYKRYQYVLAAKNIRARHDDIVLANSDKPRIYIWDDNFREYYDDLFNKIGRFAKYNLLGEIGVRPSQDNNLQIPASEYSLGNTKMYLFFVDPYILLEVSYVARRDRPGERYYQRIIKKKRLSSIASYINEGNVLPNNLIIAFGETVKKLVKFHPQVPAFTDLRKQLETYGVRHGILEFPRDYRSCWVVDGQHRLYSFIGVEKPMVMPVLAFKDLDLEGQCKIFLDINKYQKKVPPDLVWDLNGDMLPTQPDGIISNVVKTLAELPPFQHPIYIPSKGRRYQKALLTLTGLCLSIQRVRLVSPSTASKVANPFYSSENPQETIRNLSQALSVYFKCLKNVVYDDWHREKKSFVLSDGGISVMIRFFERIVARTREKGAPTTVDYQHYLRPIDKLLKDVYSNEDSRRRLARLVSNEGGKDDVLREFVLYAKKILDDPFFGGEISSPGGREIKKLEERFQDLVRLKYLVRDGNLLERIPENISQIIRKRMEQKKITSHESMHRMLGLGDCVSIMRSDKEVFYGPFLVQDQSGFETQKDFEVALDHICRMRTPEMHSTLSRRRIGDEEILRIYLEKINRCLDNILPIEKGQLQQDDPRDDAEEGGSEDEEAADV